MKPCELYQSPTLIDWDNAVVIDFESYFDRHYRIRKMTTERYIRCDQWECIGVSVKVGDGETVFYPRETGINVIADLVKNMPRSPFVSHNNTFDFGSWRCDITFIQTFWLTPLLWQPYVAYHSLPMV